eukprot:TRINITY_DN1430_c0_g1_i3.p3 TRINITY_DN1430_c0_g1~~TRINITY_DN1430_c0_g1_i3.p3  ORF type:complete len:146 (-),score=11.16 TRINITY_DN1430_c0_g1_i3:127-564(-)
MSAALREAKLSPADVDYINAHGTSTPMGDGIELRAIQRLRSSDSEGLDDNNPLFISSTKGATGHLLGAAGSVEAIYTALALYHGVVPPTLNFSSLGDTDFDNRFSPSDVQIVASPLETSIRFALTNSFGFGGTNACLALAKSNSG